MARYGQEYGATLGTKPAPACTTACIGVSYEWNRDITLNASIQNLPDKRLGLAMDRHRRELPGSFTLPLRTVGSAFLAASSCVACLDAGSISMGIFWWLGLLGIAGMTLGVQLANRP